jgi:hypothetical protein
MDLPPVTSAVILITSNFGKTWVSRRNVWDVSADPSGIKRKQYVCMYKMKKIMDVCGYVSVRPSFVSNILLKKMAEP